MWKKLKRLLRFRKSGKAGKPAKSPVNPVDRQKEIATLRADALALYERFQSGSLRDDDIVELEDLELPKVADYLQRLHEDAGQFSAAMGEFAKAYSPFGIFGEDEVVIESGADWGYSVLAMRSHGCRAKIVSVEAAPFHRVALDRLVELESGGYEWVNAAFGEHQSELSLYTPVVNRKPIGGLTSVGATLDAYFVVHVTSFAEQYVKLPDRDGQTSFDFRLFPFSVKSVRIPDIPKQLDLAADAVAAIKLDVEGHEGPVLAGARDFLAAQRPMIMNEGANRSEDVRTVLQSLGYQHHELHQNVLRAVSEISQAQDGYWLHPAKLESYRSRGLLVA